MKWKSKKQDFFVTTVVFFASWLMGSISLALFLSGFVALIVLIQLELFRRNQKMHQRLENEIHQAHAQSNLYTILSIHLPLPEFRGWAISPDLGWIYISHIFQKRPTVILECGSGISTLLSGYALKRLGKGKVIALEHDQTFAQITAQYIQEHNLQEFASVAFAPLIKHKYKDKEFFWYDISKIHLPSSIELLFIDGPPGHLQSLSRYAALPLLQPLMDSETTILLDDTNRPDEQAIINRWITEFSLEQKKFKAEKGAILLSFKPSRQP